jgi:hypothetical protein
MAFCFRCVLQVLQNAAELQALGDNSFVVGPAWTGCLAPTASGCSLAAADGGRLLDAHCRSPASLIDSLQQQLSSWIQQGFDATAVLLSSGEARQLSAVSLATGVGAAALDSGMQLAVSWRLVAESTAQQHAASGARKRASRQGKEGVSSAAGSSDIGVSSHGQLEQLTAVVQRQLQAIAAQAAAREDPPPALLLKLVLGQGPGHPAPTLHIVQPGSQDQAQQLTRLVREVADLHQRRRQGKVLTTSRLVTHASSTGCPGL